MLPVAMTAGVCLYLGYRALPCLHPAGHVLHRVVSEGQRFLVAVLLFCQFVKISPHDLQLRRWHGWALSFQVLTFLALTAIAAFTGPGIGRILLECGMLCIICPAAAASGVITEKLGGSLAGTVTYVTITNAVATFLIPLAVPIVCPSADLGFWAYVGHIALKVFPVLVLPALVAWLLRYTTHRLQRKLMRWSQYAFYIWGVCLSLAMLLATRALALSGIGLGAVMLVVLVSLAACALQFFLGRKIGRDHAESITAGQSLGQKNNGFLIWLGYTYFTPVTSVAGGLYAIWQNLFNSWQLYRRTRGDSSLRSE
ncbi:MAG: transporter [Bacteroidales bacterium]|nr:transporter [Bacteroidales bacterium]